MKDFVYNMKFWDRPVVNLPQSLNLRRIYILPTRYGIIFIIVLLSMLTGSVNYNNNLGFLLTFLLGSMAIVSTIHTCLNLAGIQILSVKTKPVFAGKLAAFEFTVRAPSFLRPYINFNFIGEEASYLNLSIEHNNTIQVLAHTNKRGIFAPKSLIISTFFPFGLFRAWSNINVNVSCIVYPSPIPGVLIPTYDVASNNDKGKKEVSGVDDFKGLRAYQQGDSLKRISWKSFSKGQGVLTKEFVAYTGSSFFISFNALHETNLERKLSRLCDMVLKAHNQNLEFGLKLPGTNILPDKGDSHKHRCLKALATFG
ncbi:MAG: DUF58 domain-containing protein [Desulfobacterales bacterium]|nr:DUF58 domain-containing protein [Desulfobacterales bacterium]